MKRKKVIENLYELLELIINDYNYFGGSEDEERKFKATVSEAIALLKEKSMKTYLAKFNIMEGEHEHHAEFLLCASSHEKAFSIAKSQEHEPTILDDDQQSTCWDYGDGTTASRLAAVVEITEEEAATLQRLGLAFYFETEKKDKWLKQVKCIDNSTFEDCLTIGKYYEVDVEQDGGGQGMDMYYLLDDNNEPLNTLAYHFTE